MATVTILGIAQDGGRPHPGCRKACCQGITPEEVRHPVSIGIVDELGNGHLIEATRALGDQLEIWGHPPLQSVFLTHAHFGHVDGLGLFGRETLNAQGIDLFVSPSMKALVDSTPHWSLMVEQGVFHLNTMASDSVHQLSPGICIESVNVPHRAELSDMHAFVVRGPNRSLLFLPDHDRWEETLAHCGMTSVRKWFDHLNVDVALVDGTFWDADELSGRPQDEVPHPPVVETLRRLDMRKTGDLEVYFLHLNHTNPLLRSDSQAYRTVAEYGWKVGEQGMQFTL